MKKAISTQTKWTKTALASSIAGVVFAVSTPSLMAQEAPAEEVVEVKGIRYSLESALNVKRLADSVVDAISAEDIDALPALDLGEALQALPGIQLNRDDGERSSEISLRGLSGSFVKTTAGGQSIATPSRSASPAGEANPFGAFEASIFDGVKVIKSPTADLQAGAIAGIVDLQFQKALDKKDGGFQVNLGTRYEDLSDQFNTTFRVQGSKHIIEDKLAIAFKVAGSGQDFRRDTVNFTQYTDLLTFNADTGAQSVRPVTDQAAIDAYRAEHGLEADSQIRALTRSGQAAEVRQGDRYSGAFNVEFMATDELKFGANFIKTRRSLDESNLEDTQFLARRQADNSQQQITLLGDPVRSRLGGPNDRPTYYVGHTRVDNANWQPANRLFSFVEDAQGLYLYGEYVGDQWEADAVISKSDSSNEFINEGIDVRHVSDGGRQRWNGTGIHVEINNGAGDLSRAYTRVVNDAGVPDNSVLTSYVYDGTWSSPNLGGFSSTLSRSVNGNRQVQFFVNGRVDRPERDMSSAEFNVKRLLDVSFGDVFRLDAVKAGLRFQEEELVNDDLRIGAGGIDTSILSEETIFGDRQLFVDTQNEYFNGEYPGFYGAEGGWRTLDSDNLRPLLQNGILERQPNAQIASPSGFAVRLAGGRNQFYPRNFDTTQEILAGYIMANFSGELGPIGYSGNFGVRNVHTDNEFTGAFVDTDGNLGTRTSERSYSHNLVSANLKFDLTDDLILRLASYDALIRPNLRVQNPSTVFDIRANGENEVTRINVDLPQSDVDPYTADNFDISLEWYNRKGSAVSIGWFTKEIVGLFTDDTRCGSDVPEVVTAFTGPTSQVAVGSGFQCQLDNDILDGEGNVFAEAGTQVDVGATINGEGDIQVSGVEFALQQKLDFLPAPFNGLGGVINYTKLNLDESDTGLSLLRVSPESYNVVGYWENDDFSVRLAYNWRDEQQLSQPVQIGALTTAFLGTDARFETDRGRLDLSMSYRFNKKFRVNFQAFNLTEDQGYEFVGGDQDIVNRIRFDGRTYRLNATYKFN